MIGIIYKYSFPNGKVYVGQTRRDLLMRHRQHINPSEGPNNPALWAAFQEFGEVQPEVIEQFEVDDEIELSQRLNALETYYIREYKATDPARGYNTMDHATSYSREAKLLEKEHLRRMKLAYKNIQELIRSIYDKIMENRQQELTEDEHKFINDWFTPENIFYDSLCDCLDLETLTLKEGQDPFFFEEALDYGLKSLLYMADYYIYDDVIKHRKDVVRRGRRGKVIQQLAEDGTVVNEFDSWNAIKEHFKIPRIDNILNVVAGRQKSAYGYRWRYKPEQ